ncbi:hypothetical protein C8J57DRAFT_184867 [Mycena rebaudengoi]|nr:hypothetical protein C8J57DRAFT_184867 [Mycena rebaudengoi]
MSLQNPHSGAPQTQVDQIQYPILTLPSEITAEIFLRCLPDGNVPPHPSNAPLLLLVICTSWRDLALSTPALWTRLMMLLDKNSENPGLSNPTKSEKLIRNWFTRAGSLPLSLTFSGTWGYSFLEGGLNGILPRYSPHLHELKLHIHSKTLSALRNEIYFPLLRHLELHFLNLFSSDGELFKTFATAPQLRTLSLVYFPPSVVSIPWEQLTAVKLRGIDVAECLALLRKAPCLQVLEFSREGDNNEPSPVMHSGLVSLSLEIARGIIPFLALPMLEQLSLKEIADPDDTIIPLPLISSKALRSFTFGDHTPIVSLQWIRHMERLTTLEICTSGWKDMRKFILALNRAHEPQFLANLQNVALLDWVSDGFEEDLLDALHSRVGPANAGLAALRWFRLQVDHLDLDVETHTRRRWSIQNDKLQKLVTGGMDIYVGTQNKKYF